MSMYSRPAKWSARVWALAWFALFVLQFVISRGSAIPAESVFAAAICQALITTIPAVSLLQLWRGPRVSRCEQQRVMWFLLRVIALSVALHHVQAIRTLAAAATPHAVYPVAHWMSAIVLTIAIPVAIVAVSIIWIIRRRRAIWRALDFAMVGICSAVLVLNCLMNGAVHTLDRLSLEAGQAWHSLTCVILPALLVMIGAAFTAQSLRRSDASEVMRSV
jgi:hypothetical protein